jgi:hypothetical protein
MTLYFFDLIDGSSRYLDSEGVPLPGDERAVGEARRIIADVLRDGLATDLSHVADNAFSVIVRTAQAETLVTIAVTLSIEFATAPRPEH